MKKYMNKTIALLVILALALLALSGCQKKEEVTNPELQGLSVYKEEKKDGYTEYNGNIDAKFSYPSNWASVGTDEQPTFNDTNSGVSVNLSSADFPENTTFEVFIEGSKLGILEKMTLDGDIKQEMINLNNRKACRLDYIAKQSDTLNIHISQIVFIDDQKVYILTLAVDQNDYESKADLLNTIIKTFKK